VEKLIKEQFGVLMYANGKGQVINRAEYLRWKFRGQEQVMIIKRLKPRGNYLYHLPYQLITAFCIYESCMCLSVK
jgi:hypothetical protein